MATVYLAIQESLHRSVALKVMIPSRGEGKAFSNRFLREGRTAASLEHRNILTVYDTGISGDLCYLAMEYVQGGDLKARISKGMSGSDSLAILCQVAEALGYAHSKGVVHRDVKPENILFRDDSTPVLADFGIAKDVGAGTQLTAVGLSVGLPPLHEPRAGGGRR